jgi:ammonia channel protein AmtB
VSGYSLSFAPGNSFIGGLRWLFLNGVGLTPNADYAGTIPHEVFMMFQMMFAVITPALIIGAFAERMKFSALCVFMLLWATLVYDPGADGLLYGNPLLFWIQIKAVFITAVYSLALGFALLKIVDVFMGLRVSEHEERVGLDLTLHREAAYTVID